MKKKIFLFLLAGFVAYLIFLSFKIKNFYQKVYTPQKKVEKKDKFNFLLFGYGGSNHQGAFLTDTIMVLHLNTKDKKAVLISIPRDLWVSIPTKSGEKFGLKINAIYTSELFPENYPDVDKKYFGSKDDASFFKMIVGRVINQKIDYYAGIDFEGFKKAIDALGGVEVNVEKSFVDFEYPIEGKENDLCGQEEVFKKAEKFLNNSASPDDFKQLEEDQILNQFVKNATTTSYLAFPCRYQKVEFKKGPTLMNGDLALKFVRSRHSTDDGSDFSRARRQQLFLEAVKNKIISFNMITKIFTLLDRLGDHFRTDVDLSLIKELLKEGKDADKYELITYVLTTDNLLEASLSESGQYILIPKKGENDFSEIWEKINELENFQSSGRRE